MIVPAIGNQNWESEWKNVKPDEDKFFELQHRHTCSFFIVLIFATIALHIPIIDICIQLKFMTSWLRKVNIPKLNFELSC